MSFMAEAAKSAALRDGIARVAVHALLIVTAAAVLVPLVATVLGGFKTLGELRINPAGWPREWVWSNYADILLSRDYWRMLGNSFLVAGWSVAITVVLSSMAAFAFAQFRFLGKRLLLGYIALGLMFPTATAVVPLFVLLTQLGLVDSHVGLIIPKVAGGMAMAVILFHNYFRAMPPELFDAAAIDGCGYFRFYWSILMPLAAPIIATVSIINFIASWNTYFLPLILLNSPELFTWPVGLMDYTDERGTDWQMICAYVTLTMLPMVLVFLAAQRHIISGLTAGAVKS
jgi:raffinose/stachyose/melibiose transport system permease protein